MAEPLRYVDGCVGAHEPESNPLCSVHLRPSSGEGDPVAGLRKLDLERAAHVIRKIAKGQKRHPDTAALLMNLAGELESVRAATTRHTTPGGPAGGEEK